MGSNPHACSSIRDPRIENIFIIGMSLYERKKKILQFYFVGFIAALKKKIPENVKKKKTF